MQQSHHILLVRPGNFIFNEQTADSNAFQHEPGQNGLNIVAEAKEEFDHFANRLKEAGIKVTVIEDTIEPVKPDAVFPNNWISTHEDGTVILYPMFAINRRAEKRADIVEMLRKKFFVKTVIDLSEEEKKERFLEGTGSIIFDHDNKVAYACLSPRTNKELFEEVCVRLGYDPVSFHARDRAGKEIYHTNVMMSVAEKFAIVCLETITDKTERAKVVEKLEGTRHQVIEITPSQMNHFAGNVLAVKNKNEETILVLSQSAFDALSQEQKSHISQFCRLLPMPVKTIEHIGGGSARCMMAEIFLPPKENPE